MLHASTDTQTSTTKRVKATKLWLISKITAKTTYGREVKQYNMISIQRKYQWANSKGNFLKWIKFNSSRHYMIGGWMNMKIMTKIRIKNNKNFEMMKMMKITVKRKWIFKDLKGQHKTQQKICLHNFLKRSKKSIWSKLRAKLWNKKLRLKRRW